MKEIIGLFWDICRFKKGPESVPTQTILVELVFFSYLLTTMVAIAVSPDLEVAFLQAFFVVLVIAAATLGLVWGLLLFKGVGDRFWPTVVALVGCDVMLTVIGLPLILVLNHFPFEGSADLLGGLLILLMGWSIVVGGFILHRALNTSLLLGSFVSFCIMLSSNTLASFFMTTG